MTSCQAFHWFATMERCASSGAIARRRAVLLQYERDERDPFTKAYGDVVRAYATDDTEALRARALQRFRRVSGRQRHAKRVFIDAAARPRGARSAARHRRRICRSRAAARAAAATILARSSTVLNDAASSSSRRSRTCSFADW